MWVGDEGGRGKCSYRIVVRKHFDSVILRIDYFRRLKYKHMTDMFSVVDLC